MIDTTTSYMGLELKSPLIAASSGLTDNIDNLKLFEEFGTAAVVLKSLFEEEIRLEKNSRLAGMSSGGFLYPETLEFYDYLDNADNESSQKYLQFVKDAKSAIDIPVIASINCITSEQWTFFPRELENAGADALELNVFIIPADLQRSAVEINDVYSRIIREVTQKVKIPVSLKVSNYFTDLAIRLKDFSESGIKGLVLFNRFYNPDIDLDTMKLSSGGVLSSPAEIYNSLRWLGIMYKQVSCDLAGSTGVHDGRGLIKMILAGASAVQVASAFYKHGIDYSAKMISDLREWMEEKGYSKIDEMKGLISQQVTGNPAAFQRVQFMRYFRGQK